MSEKRKAKKEAKRTKKLDKKTKKLEKKALKKAKRGKNKEDEHAELENIRYIAEGFCGEDEFSDLSWHIDEDGTLYITGNGYMSDFMDDPHFSRPWSAYAESIKTVYIDSGVRYIGDFAFHGLYDLVGFGVAPDNKYLCAVEGVLFNKDLTTLIRYPLAGEPEYIIPATVTELTDYSFSDCPVLEKVFLTENVIEIGHHAFSDCPELKAVVDGLGIQRIPDSAFRNCTSLSDFEVWTNVVSIGDHAFTGCSNLKTVFLGRNVREIGIGIIDLCGAFDGFEVDEENACFTADNGILFNKNESMLIKYPSTRTDNSYIVPRKVKDIAESSFAGTDSLTVVVLPNDLKTIGRYAFNGCRELNMRELPPNLIYVGEFIFG